MTNVFIQAVARSLEEVVNEEIRKNIKDGMKTWFLDPGTHYHTDYGRVEQFHHAGRMFFGSMAGHKATWGSMWFDPVLSFEHKILHNWATRDSQLSVSNTIGGMAIVGMSQASHAKNMGGWPAFPNFGPASIGISGFAINDQIPPAPGGGAWGGYFDAVRFPGASFTVGLESAVANLGEDVIITPFNFKSVGGTTVAAWLQSGCGLDAVDYTNPSNPNRNIFGPVGNISAYIVTLSSFVNNAAKAWSGIIIGDGSIVDRSAGSNVYEAFSMPTRHQIVWYRSNGTPCAFIWNSNSGGVGQTGININNQYVEIVGDGGIKANRFQIEDYLKFAIFDNDVFWKWITLILFYMCEIVMNINFASII